MERGKRYWIPKPEQSEWFVLLSLHSQANTVQLIKNFLCVAKLEYGRVCRLVVAQLRLIK